MKRVITLAMIIAAAVMVFGATADNMTVTGVTAQQRYPWNGIVDIAVTFSGASNDVARVECTFVATNTATQTALPIVNITRADGASGDGDTWTRWFVWDAAADVGEVKIDDVVLTVEATLGGVQLWENGPYWAECNVGATKPEEYGYYFWWGDTVGYKRNGSSWDAVDGSQIGFSFSSGNCPTYGKDCSQLQSTGYIDANGNLMARCDAATVHFGASWRMPTDDDFLALINNCDTEWTKRNGVSGCLVKGKKDFSQKSIFLPFAGVGASMRCDDPGVLGTCWSSTADIENANYAWYVDFKANDFPRGNYRRYYGRSVRPLRDPVTLVMVYTHLALDNRINPEMPAISPNGKTVFEDSQSVTITCASDGAVVHYTTNGEDPSVDSPIYQKCFRVDSKTTVKAIAIYGNGNASDVAVASFAFGQCPDPVIVSAGGETFLHKGNQVSIDWDCADGVLRYTTDGSDVSETSPVYAGPFTIDETTTIKAKAFGETYFDSKQAELTVTREREKIGDPTVSTSVASSGLSVLIDIDCLNPDVVLHYTLDGSDPTTESPIFIKPFYAFDTSTLKVIAVKDDFTDSDVITKDIAIYCVIDLSGGPNAVSYPVSYVVGAPDGGWADEYKTTKLVLRKINVGNGDQASDILLKPFYIGVFEVTQKQYALVTGNSPSYFTGDMRPVERVTWSEIRGSNKGMQYPDSVDVDEDSFLGKLRICTGLCFDLPTEAKWEYSCRAGTTTTYSYGDIADGAYMWYSANAGSTTHDVGTRKANSWGLFDMHGNVSEWCLEWGEDNQYRIVRGGDWKHDAGYCTSGAADRGGYPSGKNHNCGFRIAIETQDPSTPVIVPSNGTIIRDGSLTVSMSCDSESATIRYTDDGTAPNMESSIYEKKFPVYGKTVVKAIAFYEDGTSSEMAVAKYALGQCPDPVIVSVGGETFLHKGNQVSIDWDCADGVLRYTTDGSDVSETSPAYVGPFTVDETTTIKAKAFGVTYFDSKQVELTVTRAWETVATPVIIATESFSGRMTTVSISCAAEGATIRYTTDGSEPNSESAPYAGPFEVRESTVVKAFAMLADYANSAVATKTITKVWGIGDSVGLPDHAFTTDGDAGWVNDGGAAMRSGKITHKQTSVLRSTFVGKGRLTFELKTSCEEDDPEYMEYDRAEVWMNDALKMKQDGEHDWKTFEFDLDGDSTTVEWRYVKDEMDDAKYPGEDCIWVRNIVWLPELTCTTEVPVELSWIREKFGDLGSYYYDYEEKANENAANGHKVWECYVAGEDPTDKDSRFIAIIKIGADGKPILSWKPPLNGETAEGAGIREGVRSYSVYGKQKLDDAAEEWTPVEEGDEGIYNFFKVTVGMP